VAKFIYFLTGYAKIEYKLRKRSKTLRILVVEDDEHLNGVIARGLKEEGYAVDAAFDGEDGKFLAEVNPYDLIVLDWMLPGLTGVEVCDYLRRKGFATPILMLTAKGTVADRVAGLDSGADDYLTKPFAFDELLARLRALLRRQSAVRSNLLQIADLCLDRRTHEVTRAGLPITLTAKEFSLLEYFMLNAGMVLSRRAIEEHAWNYDFESESNLIDVYIRRLRRKIDDPFELKLFETIKGAGYRLRTVPQPEKE
jgi:DNA-binding response OmpR family regulator